MQTTQLIDTDTFYIGCNDNRLALFENIYPIEKGVSYNSYVVLDDKTVLLDTCDKTVSEQFFTNLRSVLKERPLDYIIINHMEPDHSALLGELLLYYPNIQIVCNAKTQQMIEQFFHFEKPLSYHLVKEADTLTTGTHTFQFVMAPMVHWPEVMVTYDTSTKILYSADAFGSFGVLEGSLYADQLDLEKDWLDEARRYYTNIVGKYGTPVQTLLKKASGLEIKKICPLHGPIWRENLSYLLDKYTLWSTYTPETQGVLLIYGSIYGHTESAVNLLAFQLKQAGVKEVALYDASKTHSSFLVGEAFKYPVWVIASSTYNAGIFPPVENVLLDFKAHQLQKRKVAIIQNGSWVPASGKLMQEILSSLKEVEFIEDIFTIKSDLQPDQTADFDAFAKQIASTLG